MKTFYVAELQNLSSLRKAEKINAKTLTSAKRAATIRQTFQGTVLKLLDSDGCLLALKERDQWRDIPYSGIPEIRV